MPKICPECKYPNPDNSETCFKCGADISQERFQKERAARANRENQRRQEAREARQ